ncbi:MAG: AAA family ATPase [Gammaproteobacteria bacterium]|nr:MAG: AAA family ATPase [Gammaproteobacteria bacterium]
MTTIIPLDVQQLHRACDPGQFTFRTTAELADLTDIIGQVRAMDAVRFGSDIRREGYNLFVLGSSGMGKHSLVQQFLESRASREAEPADWCYLNNFAQPHKPKTLKLPCGKGEELRLHMERLVDYLRSAIPVQFESEEYRNRINAIQQEYSERQEREITELDEEAEKKEIILLRTPEGFALAPSHNREVVPPEEYDKLPQEKKDQIEADISELQAHLEKILSHLPQRRRERSERIKQLNHEIMRSTAAHIIDELRALYADLPDVLVYFDAIQQDMVMHVDDFRKPDESINISGMSVVTHQTFNNYQVNVLTSNHNTPGAPVVCEDNPTYSNLVGRVEHVSQFGALVTHFTLIKPGALHRANGGYLLLDIRKVLMQPFAWEGLKRALQARKIHIESLGQIYSLVSTVSLEPEPVPLDVKVILFGERLFYYLLQEYDPEFKELFKVAADFEETIERTPENHFLYAQLIATLARKEGLLPYDRHAVARVIDHSARLTGDSKKLSMHMRSIADLLHEADYWARANNLDTVRANDVQQAIDAQIRRQDRIRDRLYEAIQRDILMISTQGAVTGQINGLSVIELGGFAFAQPTRITATTRFGKGDVINVEREVKLSGAIHSKGVFILSSFLAARYAKNQPLALSASLAFEQSYGMIDGDSASLAELCALLSNLADAPVNQALAVTGSINQLGQVQAIGAVNEKIEGFFDICNARGLTGDQGVLIPAANVQHLMLRRNVVDAAAAGKFHIYAVADIDQAIALLTGFTAGEAGANGEYPAGSINGLAAARLAELGKISQSFQGNKAY